MCWILVAYMTLAHGQGEARLIVDPCMKDCPARARAMQAAQDANNPLLRGGLPVPHIVYACELGPEEGVGSRRRPSASTRPAANLW